MIYNPGEHKFCRSVVFRRAGPAHPNKFVAKHRVLTAAEIQQREEYLAAGRVWPPVEEHVALARHNEQLQERLAVLESRKKLSPADRHRTLDQICEKYGVEPAEELIKMVMERNDDGTWRLSNDQRIKILSELQQYRMPKLKSIEVQGTVDHTLTVVVKKFGDIEEKVVRTFDIDADIKPMKR